MHRFLRKISLPIVTLFFFGGFLAPTFNPAVANAAASPIGAYDSCVGTCGCQPKTQSPAVAAGSVINECGMVSSASISGNKVYAWGESATLSVDGSTLAWDDGSNWIRAATTPIRCRVHETAVSGVNWPGLDTWYGTCEEACQNNGAAWSAYYHSQYPNADPFSYGMSADNEHCIEYHAGQPYSTWGFEKEAVEPPTRGEEAAARSKDLVGTPYTYGGKGQDRKTGLPLTSDDIDDGYTYWNPNKKAWDTGYGVDCSGLVKWAYNSTRGNSDIYIAYDNADGQFWGNSEATDLDHLKPGDLLFFSNNNGLVMDHVAMYVGDGQVVEAPRTGYDTHLTTLDEASARPSFQGFAKVTAPRLEGQFNTHSPVSLEVTDPEGYHISDQTIQQTQNEFLTEVPRQLYYSKWSLDQYGWTEDTVTVPHLKPGNYSIKVVPRPEAASTDTYSLDAIINGQIIQLATDMPITNIPNLGYGITLGEDGSVTTFSPVQIKIKSDDTGAVINPKSRGKLSVALLSSSSFDATKAEVAGLRFGISGKEARAIMAHVEDSNADGKPDLVLKFQTQDTGLTCATTSLALTGKSASGLSFWGAQPIRTTCH